MMPDVHRASCSLIKNIQNGLIDPGEGKKNHARFLHVHQLGFPRESQRTPPRASSGVSVSTAICPCRTKLVQHTYNSDRPTSILSTQKPQKRTYPKIAVNCVNCHARMERMELRSPTGRTTWTWCCFTSRLRSRKRGTDQGGNLRTNQKEATTKFKINHCQSYSICSYQNIEY